MASSGSSVVTAVMSLRAEGPTSAWRHSPVGAGRVAPAGLTTPNLAESETTRTFIKLARRVVVIADHTKWGLVSLSSFADLSEVDVLITDDMLPADARAQAADQVGEMIFAESMSARLSRS